MAQEQSIDEVQSAPPQQGRRNDARLRLYLPGRVKTLEGEVACFVENISQTGARIIVMDSSNIGRNGILRCGELDIFFERVWADDGRAGLAFDELVAPETLHELRCIHDNFDSIQRKEIRQMAQDWVHGLIGDN